MDKVLLALLGALLAAAFVKEDESTEAGASDSGRTPPVDSANGATRRAGPSSRKVRRRKKRNMPETPKPQATAAEPAPVDVPTVEPVTAPADSTESNEGATQEEGQ